MSVSVLQNCAPDDHDKAMCYFCRSMRQLERHHVYQGNPNRDISEREGCWCWLCHQCHFDVHHHVKRYVNGRVQAMMDHLHEECQRKWEQKNDATHDGFRAVFGRSYL